jgi:thiamine pyrophosphate-dependent acetolactate synthase large subunit-like protein
MGISELETAVRLGLGMVIVVYDDAGYGAEFHHFAGDDHTTVRFGDTDIAAVARGHGCDAAVVRSAADLGIVGSWLDGPRDRPLLLDAKVVDDGPSWWLAEAFKGH